MYASSSGNFLNYCLISSSCESKTKRLICTGEYSEKLSTLLFRRYSSMNFRDICMVYELFIMLLRTLLCSNILISFSNLSCSIYLRFRRSIPLIKLLSTIYYEHHACYDDNGEKFDDIGYENHHFLLSINSENLLLCRKIGTKHQVLVDLLLLLM